MTADPTQIRSPLEAEARARRAAQHDRAERARLGEVDRRIADEHQCPECGPAAAGDPTSPDWPGINTGFVPVRRTVAPGQPGNAQGSEPVEVVEWRPCFTCSPDRWRAWQEATLRSPRRPKAQAQGNDEAQEGRRRERSSSV